MRGEAERTRVVNSGKHRGDKRGLGMHLKEGDQGNHGQQ